MKTILKVPVNYVLVEPEGKLLHTNGVAVESFVNPYRHVSVYGKVIGVPDNLLYLGRKVEKLEPYKIYGPVLRVIQQMVERSLEFETKMEISIGDRVLFNYVNYLTAEDENEFVIYEGRKMLLMRYDLIYAVVNGDAIKPVNGWIFVRNIKLTDEERVSGGVMSSKTVLAGAGHVLHVGTPVKHYLHHDIPDNLNVRQGDIVCFRNAMMTTFEYKYHQTLNKSTDSPVCAIRRKDILGFLEKEPEKS